MFAEVEREELVVRTVVGDDSVTKRIKEKTHGTEDAARYAYGKRIQQLRSAGFVLAGPSEVLAAPPPEVVGSALLAEEHFAAGDERFLSEALRVTAGGKLAGLAERWYTDARPWARRALLAYIDDGCARPHHKGLVKRLFKLAEARADDEVMAHFLVAFDSFELRVLVKASRWDDALVLRGDPVLPERLKIAGKIEDSPVFSRATRRYLARRAYRYFRLIGHADPARYGRALRIALPVYRDEALATPAGLLDAWGLLHALYRYSAALHRTPRGFTLADDAKLDQLAPAPHIPAAWQGVFDELCTVLITAHSRTVRAWTSAWLRSHHADDLAKLPFSRVKLLLASPHDELRVLGAELLPTTAGLDTLPIGEWLELLAIEHLDVISQVCELVEKHVAPSRLSLEQCIDLACAKTAPVARLGLTWARAKRVDGARELAAIARIAKAGVPSVRDEGTAWATQIVATHPQATPEHLRDLCDAPHADARGYALAAVAAKQDLAPPSLWFALTESPYEDVRREVLRNAKRWRDEAPKATLRHVWSTAMLDVNRGSTTKRRVPRQIAERIASHPDEAAELLPILRIALRSVRAPERATAIAALARAVHGDAELRALARELIPELEVTETVTQ